MKSHNRALDYVLLAMKELRSNKPSAAATMLAKAVGSADAVKAMKILEASNRQGFANDQRRGRGVYAADAELADPLSTLDAYAEGDDDMDMEADLDDGMDIDDDGMDMEADIEDDEEGMEGVGDDIMARRRMARVLSGMKRSRR